MGSRCHRLGLRPVAGPGGASTARRGGGRGRQLGRTAVTAPGCQHGLFLHGDSQVAKENTPMLLYAAGHKGRQRLHRRDDGPASAGGGSNGGGA